MARGILFLSVIFLGLSACKEVDVVDGKIPEAYRNEVLSMLGVYNGTSLVVQEGPRFHAKGDRVAQGYIEISEVEDRLILKVSPDIAGPHCQSRIGLLKKLVFDDSNHFESAVFDFDPNFCANEVKGRQVIVRINGSKEFLETRLDRSDGKWDYQGQLVDFHEEHRGGYIRR